MKESSYTVSYMNEQHIMTHEWLSHVTTNESCHIHEGFILHTRTSSTSWHTNHWVISLRSWNYESCHTYDWIMSNTRMSWTLWYTYDWVMSLQMSHVTRVKESYHTHERAARHDTPMIECARWNKSCHTYEWVMLNKNKKMSTTSRHTYEWVILKTRMSTTSRHTSDWVMSLKMCHVTHTKESYHTHERAARHDTPMIESHPCAIRISHVTHMNGSCHTHQWAEHQVKHLIESCHDKWVMSHIWMSRITDMNAHHIMTHQWLSHVPTPLE